MNDGYIAVDLDGTLAFYDMWRGVEHIGAPIVPMINTIRRHIEDGYNVKIFTARVSHPATKKMAEFYIKKWAIKHIGQELEVTNCKDYDMLFCYDDRAVQVERNTGKLLGKPEIVLG